MGQKILQIISDNSLIKEIRDTIEKSDILNRWEHNIDKSRFQLSLLIETQKSQELLDKLQPFLRKHPETQIFILPIEATLPNSNKFKSSKIDRKTSITREEMYNDLYKNSKLTFDYLFLIFCSTLVASVGLITNNIAVLVGAMVIAPFLGPNLALAFGTATGEIDLIKQAVRTKIIGLLLVLLITIPIGFFIDHSLASQEILSRTSIDYYVLILALASGAAGVLSLTGGANSIMVGVMVAVALLPPTTVLGLMIGKNNMVLATGAFELLLANIVCLNLSAKIVFYIKGISARTWYRKKKAKNAMKISLAMWVILFIILMFIIFKNSVV